MRIKDSGVYRYFDATIAVTMDIAKWLRAGTDPGLNMSGSRPPL